MNRRDFLTASGIAALSAAALTPGEAAAQSPSTNTATLETAIKEAIASATSAAPSPVGAVAGADIAASVASGPLDLSPAKWLWYPGDRTLPNTFVLFRRVLKLSAKPRKASGWIIGESRYQLEVNGQADSMGAGTE